MADDATTQGGIGGLGSPVYIYGCMTMPLRIKQLGEEMHCGKTLASSLQAHSGTPELKTNHCN